MIRTLDPLLPKQETGPCPSSFLVAHLLVFYLQAMRFTPDILSKLSPEARELAPAINGALDDLDGAKLVETRLLDWSGVALAWKISALEQSIIHRATDLAEASLREMAGGHHLSMVVLARAVIETISLFHDLAERLKEALDAGDLERADRLVMHTAFAARVDEILSSPDYAAPSILGPIDRLNKKIKGIRGAYDALSEFAHPNGMGHQHFYGRMDKANLKITFSRNQNPAADMTDLLLGGLIGLLWMRDQVTTFDALLARVVAIGTTT